MIKSDVCDFPHDCIYVVPDSRMLQEHSDSLGKMRRLLRCGRAVHSMRQERIQPVSMSDTWIVSTNPVLMRDISKYAEDQAKFQAACFALERIYSDIVSPRSKTSLQWTTLDIMLRPSVENIKIQMMELPLIKNLFSKQENGIESVNLRFVHEKIHLEAIQELLWIRLMRVQRKIQRFYVDIGLYTPNNLIESGEMLQKETEEFFWNRFCERVDSVDSILEKRKPQISPPQI